MKRRDIIKKLSEHGYKFEREGKDHTIYSKKGYPPAPVPRHREVNEYTAEKLLKDAGIK